MKFLYTVLHSLRTKMAKARPRYSDVVKKNLITERDEKDILAERIRHLKNDIPLPYKEALEDIERKFENIQLKNVQDKQELNDKINQLIIRVSNLERQIEKLQRIDTIDAGEAMKIMEIHVASFILPPGEKIASVGAFDQMLESKKNENRWEYLRNQCEIEWTSKHLKVKEDLIKYRNSDAHYKKFDLAQLTEAMIKRMPHREQQCKDLVVLFERVNSLMKFGMITSESVVRDVAKRKLRKEGLDVMISQIERECYRDVQYLQDITIEKAKEHLIQYIPGRTCLISNLTEVIKETNGPRLGNVVKRMEMEIVSQILQNPTIVTFNDLNNSGSTEANSQWNELIDGKAWSEAHNKAITELKKLSNGKYDTVNILPLNIAQLHIPDFLGETLWEAGSDVLKIFTRWEKRDRK